MIYCKSFSVKNLLKTFTLAAVISVTTISCGSSKSVSSSKKNLPAKGIAKDNLRSLDSDFSGSISNNITELLKDADKYLGAPYKFGGDTSAGFDCSGFALKVFNENDIKLPRRSSDQANTGDDIRVKEIKPGDLLFFATSGGTKVSHVGIVHSVERSGEIKFVHASTSKGVIISSLHENYWNKAFLHAKRVL
ncbi:hydrolase Nlp/P60 [Chryseobacterium sp. Leaf180]|nr:C40 family peptidase [Chryseobacterium sp. Leaf180]KQR94663.1 hydrolase Nlp/P60 [Chryseobacterium sp. Leaf180]